MKTSDQVYNALLWDQKYDADIHIIGYRDFDGIAEIRVSNWVPIKDGGKIPFHRIEYIRQFDGLVLWHKTKKIDHVFGSSTNKERIYINASVVLPNGTTKIKQASYTIFDPIATLANLDFVDPSRFRKTQNKRLQQTAKAILNAGCKILNKEDKNWATLPETTKQKYWANVMIERPDGIVESAHDLLARMINPPKEKIKSNNSFDNSFEIVTCTKNKSNNFVWQVTKSNDKSANWFIEAKLVLTKEQIMQCMPLIANFAPFGNTTSLQADTHVAGHCMVGMVASYDGNKIPFIPISGDIGCGMQMIPLVLNDKHLNKAQFKKLEMQTLQCHISYLMRTKLHRNVPDSGSIQYSKTLIQDSLSLIPNLHQWLDLTRTVLKKLCIEIPHNDKNIDIEGLTSDQQNLLTFMVGFTQSLGSSGNHFMELSHDTDGYLYLVVHSGSRAFGSLIYNRISELCRAIYGSCANAIGPLATLYNQAFDVLNTFAIFNRVSCTFLVLKELGLETKCSNLMQTVTKNTPLFSNVIVHHTPGNGISKEIQQLMRGITHNGIKIFASHKKKQILHVMCKGSIALSQKAACSIVALRAGEGCYVFTLLNKDAEWTEISVIEGQHLLKNGYTQTTDLTSTDIVLSGHGAGRNNSATNTWKNSEFKQVYKYYRNNGIVGNLSPNILGDNPKIAYKPTKNVVAKLPLDKAITYSTLKTLVSHKEGIKKKSEWQIKCINYFQKHFGDKMKSVQETKIHRIMMDLPLVKRKLENKGNMDWYKKVEQQQQQIAQEFQEKWTKIYNLLRN